MEAYITGDIYVCLLLLSYCSTSSFASRVLVTTEYGRLRGETSDHEAHGGSHIHSFKGVPYSRTLSKPFELPKTVNMWSGVRDAVEFGPSCPRTGHAYTDKHFMKTEYIESLDCLYLNIYTPSLPAERASISSSHRLLYGEPPYPVLVYLPNEIVGQHFEPADLVSREKVLVVTVNSRAAPNGFMCWGDISNLALQDQQKALEWIQKTIHTFHGDPARVTLLGNGDTAIESSLHMFLSKSRNLFSRLWLSSSSLLNPTSMMDEPEIERGMEDFISSMECNSTTVIADIEQCILGVNEDMLSDWYTQRQQNDLRKPCIDGVMIKDMPYRTNLNQLKRKDVDIVLGFPYQEPCEDFTVDETIDEHIRELLYDKGLSEDALKYLVDDAEQLYQDEDGRIDLCDITTDALLITPMMNQADIHSNRSLGNTGKVYVYEYLNPHNIRQYPEEPYHSERGDDIWSILGVPCSPSSFQEDNGCPLSKQMMTYFANFMRNGDPNSPATSHIWPLYRASSSAKQTKLLSVRHSTFLRVTKNYKQDEINLWNRYLYSESLKDTTEYQEDCSGVDQCEEKVKLPPPADVTYEANEAPLPKDEL